LTVFLTLLLASGVPPIRMGLGGMIPAALGELGVGLLIGLGFRWSMAAAVTAGELIGLQMGLGVGAIMDPLSGSNATVIERLYSLTFLALFFTLGGHHWTLLTLNESLRLAPIGAAEFSPGWLGEVVRQSGESLALGVRLAAGVVIPLLVLMFAMALTSRAFPQANMFNLSFTFSLISGMALMVISADSLREAAAWTLRKAGGDVLRLLAGGG
jgi:flagellar biosynthetic protein FliR